jgi:hypothetical protein
MNKQTLQADAWNMHYSIGTPVTRYALINPLRIGKETKTTSGAWIVNGEVMIKVEGVSGFVLLESVKLKES